MLKIIALCCLASVISGGVPPPPVAQKIIGGNQIIDEGNFPFLVSVQATQHRRFLWWWVSTGNKAYCGGSLINDRWILTAAHCFDGKSLGDEWRWRVRLATKKVSHNIGDHIGTIFGDIFNVPGWKDFEIKASRVIIHGGYIGASNQWSNDIALVKLSSSVPSGGEFDEIQKIALPAQDSNWPEAGTTCIMVGWGCNSAGQSVSQTSMKVQLPIKEMSECERYFGVAGTTRVCAGYDHAGKGICAGDSGGPLTCDNNGKPVQVGVASFASANTPGDYPGVFTRVSNYVSWINRAMSTY